MHWVICLLFMVVLLMIDDLISYDARSVKVGSDLLLIMQWGNVFIVYDSVVND